MLSTDARRWIRGLEARRERMVLDRGLRKEGESREWRRRKRGFDAEGCRLEDEEEWG